MRKAIWGVVAALAMSSLVACGGGTTVSGPDEVVAEAPAPAPVAVVGTPAPVAPVVDAPGGFELTCSGGSTLSVKNNSGNVARIDTFYTSFENQSLVFGKQEHTVQNGDSVTRTFEACQQADADRPGVKEIGGCFFDVNGKPFNPTREPEKAATCTAPTPRPTPSPEPSPEPTCEEVNTPRGSLGALSWPTYTPAAAAVPAVTKTVYWYDAEQGNDGPNIQNDCEDEGGTYYHQIKIPNSDNSEDVNVCKTTVNHGSSWEYDNNDYASREATEVVTITPAIPATPASGGNPISGSATVYNEGTWKLILRATDPGNYEKDTDTATVECGGSAQLSVSYPWVGHSSEHWKLELYRNNVLVSTSAVVNSPVN